MQFLVVCYVSSCVAWCSGLCGVFVSSSGVNGGKAGARSRRYAIRKIVSEHGLGPEWCLQAFVSLVEDGRTAPRTRLDCLAAIEAILVKYAPDSSFGPEVFAALSAVRGRGAGVGVGGSAGDAEESEESAPGGVVLSKYERSRVDNGVLSEAEGVF